MPASIVHMLISKEVRKRLSVHPDHNMAAFVEGVMNAHCRIMEFGALGPDIPYYQSLLRILVNAALERPDKPMGVDPWSFQFHSKDPNTLPLRMIEVIWKEDPEKDWDKQDKELLAFVCGFLAHMAADQIIHPVVNRIAGSYYKNGTARLTHRQCEICQDIYALSGPEHELPRDAFRDRFDTWCDPTSEGGGFSLRPFRQSLPVRLTYLIQKSLVEAHAVAPSERVVNSWARGTLFILRVCNHTPLYKNPYRSLFTPAGKLIEGDEYRRYILLEPDDPSQPHDGRTYDFFFEQAVQLAMAYVEATFQLYRLDDLLPDDRARFLEVVRNADLSSPLEHNILQTAQAKLAELRAHVDTRVAGQRKPAIAAGVA